MLVGEFQHTLDTKGRIFIPAKLREDIGDFLVVCKNMDRCLSVYSKEEWTNFEKEIQKRPFNEARMLIKYYHWGSRAVELDKQGRILLPPNLLEYANITKDAVVVGALDHIEIWDKQAYDDDMATITDENISGLMSKFNNK